MQTAENCNYTLNPLSTILNVKITSFQTDIQNYKKYEPYFSIFKIPIYKMTTCKNSSLLNRNL